MENQINDCFVDFFGRKPNQQELWYLINDFPKEIINLALQYGWNDSEVAYETFRWIKQYKESL